MRRPRPYKFCVLADVEGAARKKSRGKKSRGKKASFTYPIALTAVQKIDALFASERDINGMSAAERLPAREIRMARIATVSAFDLMLQAAIFVRTVGNRLLA